MLLERSDKATIRGTLAEIRVGDLLRFAGASRRTGELLLLSEEGPVSLYYRKGSLVHALGLDAIGLDALRSAMSARVGTFEFRHGVEAEDCTIFQSLDDALAECRERPAPAGHTIFKKRDPRAPFPKEWQVFLDDLDEKIPHLTSLCAWNQKRSVVFERTWGEPVEAQFLSGFVDSFQKARLTRSGFESELYTAALATHGSFVIGLTAHREATLGQVLVALDRLLSQVPPLSLNEAAA